MRKIALLLAVSLIVPIPSWAGTPEVPDIVDIAGDANLVNNQSQESVPEQNVSTTPASIDGADLRAIWMQTLYSTTKDRDPEGRVLAVRHIPEALRINFRTTAPAKPTFGPGIIFRMAAGVGGEGCHVQFQAYLAGSAPGASQLERTEINKLRPPCAGGVATVGEGFSHSITGNVLSLTFPFAATSGLLFDGEFLTPTTRPHTRLVLPNAVATVPAIDQTAVIPMFTIGSDVPPNVDCIATPAHADCA